MTTPSSAPARIRRAIIPVLRTLSLSPKRVCRSDPSSSPMPLIPATPGTGKASRNHPSRIPRPRKVIPVCPGDPSDGIISAMSPTKIVLVVT
jgi:hypothetical protein